MITIDQIRQRVNGLPSIPASVMALTEIAANELSGVEDVYRVLEKDPALSSGVLRLANSPLLAADNPICDLRTAIQRLGMDNIISMSRGVAVIRNFKVGESLDVMSLWQHSTSVGLTAKAVCELLKCTYESESAFLAGLLHDIGKIALDRCFQEYYKPVLKAVKAGEIELLKAEAELLGITHDEVGAQVAIQWNFPEKIIDVIRYHHCPKRGDFLSNLIHYSDLLVRTRLPLYPLDQNLVLSLDSDEGFKEMISGAVGAIPDLEYLTFRIDDEVDRAIAFVQQAYQD